MTFTHSWLWSLWLVLALSPTQAQRPEREAYRLSKGPLIETFTDIKRWTHSFSNAPNYLDTLDFVEFSRFYSVGSGSGLQRGDSSLILNATGATAGKRCGFKFLVNSQDRLCTELLIQWHKVPTGVRDSNPRACSWQVLFRLGDGIWTAFDFERSFFNHSLFEGGSERLILPSTFSDRSHIEIAIVSSTIDRRYLDRDPAGSRPRLAIDCIELRSILIGDSLPDIEDSIVSPDPPPCDTLYIHDTVERPVPVWIFDTTYILQTDTLLLRDTLTLYDSIWFDLSDSSFIPPCDTLYIVEKDTLIVRDTVHIRDTIRISDTIVEYVPAWIYDTIYIRSFDTLWFTDTVFIIDTVCPNELSIDRNVPLGLTIDPNPSSQRVRLYCSEDLRKVDWYDMQGKRVYPHLDQRGKEWYYDVSRLSGGLYIVRCQTRHRGTVIGKVAIVRP